MGNSTKLRLFIFLLPMIFAVFGIVSSCGNSGSAAADINLDLQLASETIDEGKYGKAQKLCDKIAASFIGADSLTFDEEQAARLAILYMKLSEHINGDENVAEATLCIRRAFSLSDDSLKAFMAHLPLEDERHMVLLRRIGISLDNPIDLTDADMLHDDVAATDSVK